MRVALNRRSVYGSRRWKRVRLFVLERDGWKCVRCNRAGRLEVHHKNPMWRSSEDPFDPAGLATLCRGCHFAEHGGGLRRVRPVGADEWDGMLP